eukprot:7007021-Pyramimonas_sp.AAC.1
MENRVCPPCYLSEQPSATVDQQQHGGRTTRFSIENLTNAPTRGRLRGHLGADTGRLEMAQGLFGRCRRPRASALTN